MVWAIGLRQSESLRRLKTETGKTLEELLGEEADDADRMQTIVWLQLTRQGFEVGWAEAGDVAVDFVAERPDPTSGGPSASSPGSSTTGKD